MKQLDKFHQLPKTFLAANFVRDSRVIEDYLFVSRDKHVFVAEIQVDVSVSRNAGRGSDRRLTISRPRWLSAVQPAGAGIKAIHYQAFESKTGIGQTGSSHTRTGVASNTVKSSPRVCSIAVLLLFLSLCLFFSPGTPATIPSNNYRQTWTSFGPPDYPRYCSARREMKSRISVEFDRRCRNRRDEVDIFCWKYERSWNEISEISESRVLVEFCWRYWENWKQPDRVMNLGRIFF